jgi:hypothetical protein
MTDRFLKAIPCSRVARVGDDGQNVVFPKQDRGPVARVLGLERRRSMSEANRKLKSAWMKTYRGREKPHAQGLLADRHGVRTVLGGPEAVGEI